MMSMMMIGERVYSSLRARVYADRRTISVRSLFLVNVRREFCINNWCVIKIISNDYKSEYLAFNNKGFYYGGRLNLFLGLSRLYGMKLTKNGGTVDWYRWFPRYLATRSPIVSKHEAFRMANGSRVISTAAREHTVNLCYYTGGRQRRQNVCLEASEGDPLELDDTRKKVLRHLNKLRTVHANYFSLLAHH